MKRCLRRMGLLLLCLGLLAGLCVTAAAQDAQARDLRGSITVTGDNYRSHDFLTDGDETDFRSTTGSCTLTLESQQADIASLYLIFGQVYGEYTVTNPDTGDSFTGGELPFLHEYLDVAQAFGGPVRKLELHFDSGKVRLSEIVCLSEGVLPDFVQRWELPYETEVDILLLAAHSDDDQLFFAGLLPLYAGARGCRVQTAYLTDHLLDSPVRIHELLNGLWYCGVTHYPVFGGFEDFRIDDLEQTYAEYAKRGTSKEQLLGYVVEVMRRFRPQVVVAHDFQGEYGHGMHQMYAHLAVQALELTADPQAYPESAREWGVWEVPKTYVHSYQKNPIIVDYDTPLEALGGRTPFHVSQEAFEFHKSQHIYRYHRWLNSSTTAAGIEKYNPREFGLYRSTVGPDLEKNDLMENLISHEEQARLEQERLEQERLEQERLEQERLEQEQLEQERLEQERLEQERLEQAQTEPAPTEQTPSGPQENRERLLLPVAALVLCILALAVLAARLQKPPKKYRGKFSEK